jgi:transposase
MKNNHKKQKNRKPKKIVLDEGWDIVNPHAAGIDLGSSEHWVAIPPRRDEEIVKCFGPYTPDLEQMAQWLKKCGITTVAMEATGIYWIPVFQLLEKEGFKVLLVNARQIKNVTGRKSDIADCQWIQKLHTFGLLGGSFRPKDEYCVTRSYLRYYQELVDGRTTQIQHMQKALKQMNLQLNEVLSDITGESGLAIINAILEGERNPLKLANLANKRVKTPRDKIAKALVGDYREEHLFQLRIALDLYNVYENKITACLEKLTEVTENLPQKVDQALKPCPEKAKNKKIDETMRLLLYEKLGVDLTAIEGVGVNMALTILTEMGPDFVHDFPTEKHWTSWLGVCPDNRISGGKVLSSHTRKVVNRVSNGLRMSASTLKQSKSALGGEFRRLVAKIGRPAAITAMAHKLARIIYNLLKHGHAYVSQGLEEAERKHAKFKMNRLLKMAESMGFDIVAKAEVSATVS